MCVCVGGGGGGRKVVLGETCENQGGAHMGFPELTV